MAGRKVLFVDDDSDDLHMIQEVLQEIRWPSGFEQAHNGEEALAQLKLMQQEGKLPCLVVMDINMPVLDGKKTLALIKQTKAYSKLPVVMFTTSISEADRAFCEGMGAEMVTKPTTYQVLKEVVVRLLNKCEV